MKIREQIKDWKHIHAERVTVEKMKKRKKKRKKEPENVVGKRKKMKKKKRWIIRTLFIFISVTFEFGTDVCFLLYYFVEIVLLKILLLSST